MDVPREAGLAPLRTLERPKGLLRRDRSGGFEPVSRRVAVEGVGGHVVLHPAPRLEAIQAGPRTNSQSRMSCGSS